MTSPKRSTWSWPWSQTKNTPFGAHLCMYFSSCNRSCVKLFLFSTVLLNITFLKIGFIVVQWENENNVSDVNEKKVVGAVKKSQKKGQQLTYWLVQTRVEWPFIELRVWKFEVSKNCDIRYVIKILSKNRYNGFN